VTAPASEDGRRQSVPLIQVIGEDNAVAFCINPFTSISAQNLAPDRLGSTGVNLEAIMFSGVVTNSKRSTRR
jgi:hypothetical protein